ncbi:metal ABC transporter permease [Bacillus sp. FJAT-47783]|uniref:metal ABC transporter permease n=1 Tax=Bacillus sp. FJAT-47783 TaxID=2922712 RepID=UPI001FAE5B0E|nr:metal ABC transporter permease [Bacillus sp. FJAT-47783]
MSYEAWILLTASLVGASCALVGTFLVLRKMAMLSDAISHSVLLGIVGAYFISQSLGSIYMLIGAGIVGLLTTLFVQLLSNRGVQSDAAIGVVFTFLFAVGVILLSLYGGNVHLDVDHALMGEITFIPWDTLEIGGIDLGPQAVWILGFVLMMNIILTALFYKEFKISAFDPEMALAIGIPVTFFHYLQMTMLSLTAVASFDSVGAILVVAMIIVPASTAYLLTDRLIHMLWLSVLIGVLSAFIGYYSASFLNVSISGAMASATGILFALAFLFSPTNGLLGKWLAKRNVRATVERG